MRGDNTGVAINLGFIAGGQGFARVAQIASAKGSQLALEGRRLLGSSLRAASPFLARGTSVFVAYDLVNQIKAYQKGNPDAVVSIVGDSIYLGVDAAEVGIEVAEAFALLEGVSSITGPIGAGIGAIVFVGTDVYVAVKQVEKEDTLIHLTGKERFIEGLRAFTGLSAAENIARLLEEKQANTRLFMDGMAFLKNNTDIQRSILPTAKTVKVCKEVKALIPSFCGGGLGDAVCSPPFERRITECIDKLEIHSNNEVNLNEKSDDIRWSRAKPEVSEGRLFCVPKGKDGERSREPAYLCDGVMGVEYTESRTGNTTYLNLGNGNDVAIGFPYGDHIVVLGDGYKNVRLGAGNDHYFLEGDTTGILDGGKGTNTLDLGFFAKTLKAIYVHLTLGVGYIHALDKGDLLEVYGIHNVLLRENKQDHVYPVCNTQWIDARGGENKANVDSIFIQQNNACTYDLTLMIRPYTKVINQADNSRFTYIMPVATEGEAWIDISSRNSSHQFQFAYSLEDLHTLARINHTLTLSFIKQGVLEGLLKPIKPTGHYEPNARFTMTVINQEAESTQYQLNDNTVLTIGEKGFYAMQASNKSLEHIIQHYPALANRLKLSLFVQTLSSNESIAIGHGQQEVLYNDPYRKSHLIGNGGENIFVVSSGYQTLDEKKLPLPEVIIYDADTENKMDTLDLREINQQLQKDLQCEVEAKTSLDNKDLLIELCCPKREKALLTVRLKEALLTHWYERLHVIITHFPMKLEGFDLKPEPLVFGADKNIMVVNPEDVGAHSELVIVKSAKDYGFYRSENNLMLSNVFIKNINSSECFTLVLKEFYQTPTFETLTIKFQDKEITLKAEMEKINQASDFNEQSKLFKRNAFTLDHQQQAVYSLQAQKISQVRSKREIAQSRATIASQQASNNIAFDTTHLTLGARFLSYLFGKTSFAERMHQAEQILTPDNTSSNRLDEIEAKLEKAVATFGKNANFGQKTGFFLKRELATSSHKLSDIKSTTKKSILFMNPANTPALNDSVSSLPLLTGRN
ncbi:hypothetical protein [Rickettsiella endosymbiont of Dermanyssus gallinae]|uniref:hypothetical protein n=1 Tax=Rickettsiella endosymbiont of Dermanyssus gallinae TaxID=2856608 RepID=UPI001C530976|nr:hypothetical protein [Rickettsiella endosymbiont of Dermanyssus gallinae]